METAMGGGSGNPAGSRGSACESLYTSREGIKGEREREEWKKEWVRGTKGQHLRDLEPEPSPTWRKRHDGRTKAQSALLIQLRTGKIGFQDFLYKRKVPEVLSGRCSCDTGAMTVRHVLLSCPKWRQARKEELGARRRDLRDLLQGGTGATAALRLVLRTGILDQFRLLAETEKPRVLGACEEHTNR